ncbi:MAG: GNAT family N-acetyltransferase [Spirochaetales bacterium]|nr:GNAT family N-acetyltransferase [Spirochaetales bacterium]
MAKGLNSQKELVSMEIQLFNEEDTEKVLDLCNNNMEFDSLSESLLREKVFDDPYYEKELNFIAWEEGRLAGFLSGVTRETESERTGYVKLMAVHRQFRRRGIGKSLYEKLEGIYRVRGIKRVSIYDVPYNYFMPGIDPRYTPALAFFETMGFRRFSDTVNLTADLTVQEFNTEAEETILAGKGIDIKRAHSADRGEVLNFISANFPEWSYEVEKTFDLSPISLHIARYRGRVQAFSAYNCNNIGTGWFGPMGTHPNLRGKGAGSVLLKRCMQDIKEQGKEKGLERAVIPWVGPIRFYSYYVNAVVERVFWRYEKLL